MLNALLKPFRWLRADMERESRTWMIQCTTCGRERSVWAAGGIRWKAFGEKQTVGFCSGCGRVRTLRIYRRAAT